MSQLSATLFCRAPELTGRVTKHFVFQHPNKKPKSEYGKCKLTKEQRIVKAAKMRSVETRNRYISALSDENLTYRELAQKMGLSQRTVEGYLKKLRKEKVVYCVSEKDNGANPEKTFGLVR